MDWNLFIISLFFLMIGLLGVISIFVKPKSWQRSSGEYTPVGVKEQIATVILFLFFGAIGVYLLLLALAT